MNNEYVLEIPWLFGLAFPTWSGFAIWLGVVMFHLPSAFIGLSSPFWLSYFALKTKEIGYWIALLFFPGIILLFCFPFIGIIFSIPLLIAIEDRHDKFSICCLGYYGFCGLLLIWGMVFALIGGMTA